MSFPKHKKRIHLFGETAKEITTITQHCEPLNVTVTFELIEPEPATTT
jgi:hypothetical protein